MAHGVFGEFMGTLVLILLGNGVVANVLLKKTKGEAGEEGAENWRGATAQGGG